MILGFLADTRSWEVDWSHCERSWYPYDSDEVLGSGIEVTLKLGRKLLTVARCWRIVSSWSYL